MNIDNIAKAMLDATPQTDPLSPLRDEGGGIVSTIAVVVSKTDTVISARATPFGVAHAIGGLFKSLKTPQEKQLILMELIAEERGIKDMPKPQGNA